VGQSHPYLPFLPLINSTNLYKLLNYAFNFESAQSDQSAQNLTLPNIQLKIYNLKYTKFFKISISVSRSKVA